MATKTLRHGHNITAILSDQPPTAIIAKMNHRGPSQQIWAFTCSECRWEAHHDPGKSSCPAAAPRWQEWSQVHRDPASSHSAAASVSGTPGNNRCNIKLFVFSGNLVCQSLNHHILVVFFHHYKTSAEMSAPVCVYVCSTTMSPPQLLLYMSFKTEYLDSYAMTFPRGKNIQPRHRPPQHSV